MKPYLCAITILVLVAIWDAPVLAEDPAPVRVVIWDERQPEQKQAYDGGFLGDYLARELSKKPDLKVTSVGLGEPNWGLPEELLDRTDVLIWWSHVRNGDFDLIKSRGIARRIRDGKLSLIVLHSGFAGQPFREAMYEVVDERANKTLREIATKTPRDKYQFEVGYLYPDKDYKVEKGAPYTPSYQFSSLGPEVYSTSVRLPAFTINGWREDGKPSHVRVLVPDHPIVAGLPVPFDIPQTEMYGEPFHVPEPDVVLFEETWNPGERFRSGCLWHLGKGNVFYFRPGHETYPVFKNKEPMQVLENATRWLAAQKQDRLKKSEK